ncbi:cytochrome P450 [Streptomyces sp. NPDC059740]|uniref:cytochrome P450 family protein n=1 Tax=Streptomyces sp. NPDC059740 TaxID=3346926 RepID=UPI0036684D42
MTLTPEQTCPYRLDVSGADIHGEAKRLRAEGPAAQVLLHGLPAWSVTDPQLIRRLLVHPDISKDAYRHWPAYAQGHVPVNWPLRSWVDIRNALSSYGTEHTRLRRPLARAFTPRRVRALIPHIQAVTRDLLDDLATSGPDDVVDFRARFAWRLPLLVVNALLGVPLNMHDAFRLAFEDVFATDLPPERAVQAPQAVYALIRQLIEHKRAEPADDVASALIAAKDSGTLTEQELADSFMLLIGAGHETTVNLLDHATVNLLTHQHQLALVRRGTVPWAQVVEETLRHQAPIATIILRFAVQDVYDAPSGLTFTAGDAIAINYAAAGRDPGTHDAPDDFDVTRLRTDHLAFGHGAHLCLGAELARLEARIALSALFAEFPHMRLAVEKQQLRPFPSFISNGHAQVPVLLGRRSSPQ